MSQEIYNTTTSKWDAKGTENYGGGDIEITDSNKDTVRVVSKPSTSISTVSSWRYITIGKCYLKICPKIAIEILKNFMYNKLHKFKRKEF